MTALAFAPAGRLASPSSAEIEHLLIVSVLPSTAAYDGEKWPQRATDAITRHVRTKPDCSACARDVRERAGP